MQGRRRSWREATLISRRGEVRGKGEVKEAANVRSVARDQGRFYSRTLECRASPAGSFPAGRYPGDGEEKKNGRKEEGGI